MLLATSTVVTSVLSTSFLLALLLRPART